MTMKILLLSCLTGNGHNSAACAVKKELEKRGVESVIKDPVSFRSERAMRMVTSTYNNMIRKIPKVYGAVYKAGVLYDSTGLTSPVYRINAGYAKRLNTYIEENGIDAVICTHLFGMLAMTAIKRKIGSKVPAYGVLTDYTNIPFLPETDIDGYFVPHEDIKEQLVQREMEAEKIYCTGIPVDMKFAEHYEKHQAREMLGMPQDKKIFLIMTGGVGCENMIKLCNDLMKRNIENSVIYVLVGKNEVIKNKLDEKYSSTGSVFTVPFTDKVNVYMCAADVMLSKSGGLSSTEAAVANIPFVSVKSIPGCETENARFFTSKGMSLNADSDKQAIDYACELAFDKEKADNMILAQRENINPNAARDIVDLVLGHA